MRQTEISGKWRCPQHVFELTIVGLPNRDDISTLFRLVGRFLDEGTYPMYWLNNIAGMDVPGIHAVEIAELARHLRHENLHWSINYGKHNSLLDWLAYIVERRTGIRAYFAKDQADALRFIRERWTGFDDCMLDDV